MHNSDYTLLGQLGTGGFGSVYLAYRKSDGQQVCIKFIPFSGGSSPTAVIREAKTLSQLDNAHIIKYYESFVSTDQFCIVMEYAPRGSLYDVINVRTFHYIQHSVDLFLLLLFLHCRVIDLLAEDLQNMKFSRFSFKFHQV